MKPIFDNALTGKALPWIVNADIPHQLVYTSDAAEITVRLLLRAWTNRQQPVGTPYEVWNYGGTTVSSMQTWFRQISELTGKLVKTQVYSRLMISFLGIFIPVLREVKEMLYLYDNTILLDDQKIRTLFPDFRPTPMNEALVDTLTWYARQRNMDFRSARPGR